MGFVGKLNLGNSSVHSVATTLYGTCDTPADTQTKAVRMQDLTYLMPGVTIRVMFTYGNTYSGPKLNVNGLGAKTIYRHGTTAIGMRADNTWAAGAVVAFTYDGTYWRVDEPFDLTQIWRQIYPVGSIYISYNATSPATLFGGTWERIQDRFLLAVGSSYTPGESNIRTGGEAEHTLTSSEIPGHIHTVGTHTHTIASHTHTLSDHTHSISHTHGIGSHTHSISHTHTTAGHTHAIGSHVHKIDSHKHPHPHTHGIAAHNHSIPQMTGTAASAGDHAHSEHLDVVAAAKDYIWHTSSDKQGIYCNVNFNSPFYSIRDLTAEGWAVEGGYNTSSTGAHTHTVTIPGSTYSTGNNTAQTNSQSAINTDGSGELTTKTASGASTATGSASPSTNGISTSTSGSATLSTSSISTSTSGDAGAGDTGGSGELTTNAAGSANSGSTGGGNAHNNMPPYFLVYMWRRTA